MTSQASRPSAGSAKRERHEQVARDAGGDLLARLVALADLDQEAPPVVPGAEHAPALAVDLRPAEALLARRQARLRRVEPSAGAASRRAPRSGTRRGASCLPSCGACSRSISSSSWPACATIIDGRLRQVRVEQLVDLVPRVEIAVQPRSRATPARPRRAARRAAAPFSEYRVVSHRSSRGKQVAHAAHGPDQLAARACAAGGARARRSRCSRLPRPRRRGARRAARATAPARR